MSAAVVAALVLAVARAAAPAGDPQVLRPSPEGLVQNLRKKLMKDNYDYVTESLDDSMTAHFRAGERQRGGVSSTPPGEQVRGGEGATPLGERLRDGEGATPPSNLAARGIPSVYKGKTNYYVSTLNVAAHGDKRDVRATTKEEDITVLRKDLLYYVDEGALAEGAGRRGRVTKDPKTAASVKYKLLKRKHKDYRRKGQTQFIQEESKNGFAIVKLGEGPFPALRLPPARRQYMRDGAEVGSDEDEVPPPSISHEDSSGLVSAGNKRFFV